MKKKIILVLITTSFQIVAITSEQAYFQLAQALKSENKIEEAIINYKKTLDCNCNHKEALGEIALTLLQQKNYESAASYFEQFLKLSPNHFDASFNLGICFDALNNHEKAIEWYNNALRLNPLSEKPNYCLGILYKKKSNLNASIQALKKAIELKDDFFDAYYHLGLALRDDHQLEAALQAFDKASQLKPNQYSIVFEQANTLTSQGKTAQALELYKKLLEHGVSNSSLLYNYAFANKKAGNINEAIMLYRQILEKQPNHSKARQGLAYAYLTIGDFLNGFKEIACSTTPSSRTLTSLASLQGKTILITATWSVEDMIQFVRYAQLIKERGAKVILQCNQGLVELLKQSTYVDFIVPENCQQFPSFDMHIPVTSLPALFETSMHNVPTKIPYVKAGYELHEQWKIKLCNDHNLKIGIYWNYQFEYCDNNAEYRNIPLPMFIPFAQLPHVSLYNLEPFKTEDLTGIPYDAILRSFGSGFGDDAHSIHHLAAIIENLDLIITRDGFIAHLAGALGRPVYLALPYTSEWRWMLERNDSPWYPSMKLFRQKTPGDWASVFENMLMTFTCQDLAPH